ncbi:MAG: hypothetical protein ABIS36_11285 [Chryseolinea sp.]
MIQTASTVPALNIIHEQPHFEIITSNDRRPDKWFRAFRAKSGFFKLSSLFYYADRIKISFTLNESYAAHYVLVKGLLEFHRSKDYKITYKSEEKTFDLSVGSNLLDGAHQFLENVTVWVDHELDFKLKLKKIIEFESDYKRQAAEVYRSIAK